ncbi:MAG: zinc ribbon domain-containing protein [Ruminococcus sp.]|nr:zinc ribbon domain-containing protein [Ruminococcus sp.]
MECPKCGKAVKEDDYICPYCSTPIKSAPQQTESDGKSKKKNKPIKAKAKKSKSKSKDALSKKPLEKNGISKNTKIALAVLLILIAVVVIVALSVYFVGKYNDSKSKKYAEQAAGYMGYGITKLNDESGVYYNDESEYYGINSNAAFDYDYVLEDSGSVSVDGISYPSWAVLVTLSDSDFIEKVVYTDFSVLKKDSRGQKHGEAVNLDSFSKGDKRSALTKYIDMDVYSIAYYQSGIVTYTYKYYYTLDNDDEQQAILRVSFNEDGEYQYYTNELVFPNNMS